MRMACVSGRSQHAPSPRLPPEISDYIVDLLHGEQEVLKRCCLLSKPWIPRARKHLFGRIQFDRPADVYAWKKAFPDPASSPGYHTHSLFIGCVDIITVADAEESSWIRAFPNVARLIVWTQGTKNKFLSPLQLLNL